MKNIIGLSGFILMVLLLGSCRPITFTMQPGIPLNAFPLEMQGKFKSTEKHKSGDDSIVLVIHEKEADINDKILDKLLHLSDTTTLSQLGDYYFYNIRQTSDGRFSWWTFPVSLDKNTLYIYTLSQGKQQKKLDRYLKLSGAVSGEYVMDNEPFNKYCKKHLRKRKAIKLKRIE